MPNRSILTTALALLLVCLALPAQAASGIALHFPDDGASLTATEVGQLRFIRSHGCRALALTPSERAAIERAAIQVDRAMSDPAMIAILSAKSDWHVEDDGWTRSATAGAELLSAWHGAVRRRVSIIAYDRGADGACADGLGDDAIHAVTPLGVPMILFNKRYLERHTHALDPDAGLHGLARTLSHELTHVFGYTHQDVPGAVGMTAYNNTVPAFVGCAVMSWPDLGYITGECGRANFARAPSPWSWSCGAAFALTDLLPGATVNVRFSERWLDARVRRVDVAGGRVEIDYGLAEVAAQWVDGCRVALPGPASKGHLVADR